MGTEAGYVEYLNKEYGLTLTGISPLMGNQHVLARAAKTAVKDFGNGLGRVVYADNQQRLIACNMEKL
jgi:hypothetical protein